MKSCMGHHPWLGLTNALGVVKQHQDGSMLLKEHQNGSLIGHAHNKQEPHVGLRRNYIAHLRPDGPLHKRPRHTHSDMSC